MGKITEKICAELSTIINSKVEITNATTKLVDEKQKLIPINRAQVINVSQLDANYEVELRMDGLREDIKKYQDDIQKAKESLFDLVYPYEDQPLNVLFANDYRQIVVSKKDDKTFVVKYQGEDL